MRPRRHFGLVAHDTDTVQMAFIGGPLRMDPMQRRAVPDSKGMDPRRIRGRR